ncbi:MAG: DUF92 domain-containing protein, partial [Thermoplasmata archaeon]|nr:DUF92 domain-containing protein [Thermoplasmata archaeon]
AIVGLALFVVFQSPRVSVGAFLIAVALAGFVGCQVDSILGETLENRGYLTKGSTNFFGMLAAVGVAAGLLLAFGAWG